LHTKKNGSVRGIKRFKCLDCSYSFRQKRTSKIIPNISELLVVKKQTYKEISKELNISISTIQRYIDEIPLKNPVIPPPYSCVLGMDCTFLGKGLGLLLIRDPNRRYNINWVYIETETNIAYLREIHKLIQLGYKIKGFVIDSRSGLAQSLSHIAPVQICQFHQQKIVYKYTTKKPRLEAGKELKEIADILPKLQSQIFDLLLSRWYVRWKIFLRERTYQEDGIHWEYTHDRLRSAYYSLKRNRQYLFTYQTYKDIPNTNSSLEGSFSYLKKKLNIHTGMRIERKIKVINHHLSS